MTSERSGLLLSAFAALLIGVVATVAALVTASQAILLDGLFNLVYFMVSLATLRVSRLASGPDDERFPFGYGYFESLVNAGKGLLILGVSGFALFDASLTLLAGGHRIAAGLSILYALFATATCSATAWVLTRNLRHADSPLVHADRDNWVVNSVISGAVLLAFCLIPLLEWMEWQAPIPYIDSLLVIAVVLLCLGVPVRMASGAILELLNRTPPRAVSAPVHAAVVHALAELPTSRVRVRMVRPGRTLYVVVHVVLPETYRISSLRELDALRERVDGEVRKAYATPVIDVVFTADDRWAEWPALPSSR
ncbi:cation diffusion facilitator family transporter [Aidingimonas halophila]|uniref:Cation diffusion facilitator family transporter n=1 Tax=Aidingimonas halophila TaxID=574349 RepID=A0A1H3D0Z1_9GAMM|nr:cation diffusion facilitator family transporter [Aidingimonas halophila]GHC30688.1 hypothetical protein GCM10008094_23840 [Aidingimonas halophila]SDX60133.1 cation diffusion facilitator family transporter [Aidingimonas halophila]